VELARHERATSRCDPASARISGRRKARLERAEPVAGDLRQEPAAVADLPLQLTTVRQPLEEITRAMADLLLRRIDDAEAEGEFVVCPTNLIRRASA